VKRFLKAAAVFALAAAVLSGCGIARVKDLDVSSVGLKYIVPTSSRSVDAVLLLGIDNPSSLPLKLHNLEGTVRMGSKVLGYVTAGEVEIQKRSDMVYEIPCTATLADGVSILEVVKLYSRGSVDVLRADAVLYVSIGKRAPIPLRFNDLSVKDFT